MSRVLVFHYYCDNWEGGAHKANTVSGDTVMVYSPKQEQVVELEVCDDCLVELNFPQITELADRMGREIEEPEHDPELVCPFGCNNSKPFRDKGGRTRHMTRKHPDWTAPE